MQLNYFRIVMQNWWNKFLETPSYALGVASVASALLALGVISSLPTTPPLKQWFRLVPPGNNGELKLFGERKTYTLHLSLKRLAEVYNGMPNINGKPDSTIQTARTVKLESWPEASGAGLMLGEALALREQTKKSALMCSIGGTLALQLSKCGVDRGEGFPVPVDIELSATESRVPLSMQFNILDKCLAIGKPLSTCAKTH